jgi:hypothetical protein
MTNTKKVTYSERIAHKLTLPVTIEVWEAEAGWSWAIEEQGRIVDFAEAPLPTKAKAVADAKRNGRLAAQVEVETHAEELERYERPVSDCLEV